MFVHGCEGGGASAKPNASTSSLGNFVVSDTLNSVYIFQTSNGFDDN